MDADDKITMEKISQTFVKEEGFYDVQAEQKKNYYYYFFFRPSLTIHEEPSYCMWINFWFIDVNFFFQF